MQEKIFKAQITILLLPCGTMLNAEYTSCLWSDTQPITVIHVQADTVFVVGGKTLVLPIKNTCLRQTIKKFMGFGKIIAQDTAGISNCYLVGNIVLIKLNAKYFVISNGYLFANCSP